MIPGPIESVCVYCGSRHGDDLAFTHEARAFGRGLAAAGLRLVYGAGDVGLMGEVARAAIEAGGRAIGVIPKHLLERELGYRDLTAFIVTETMHERKKIMLTNAEAVVAMPGGAGTLDELIEAMTWAQLGLHRKPIILMNVNDFWRPFLDLIDYVQRHGFAEPELRSRLIVVHDATAALAALRGL